MSKKRIIIANFFAGLSWGFGSAVGASVVFAIIGTILNKLGVFDFLRGLTSY